MVINFRYTRVSNSNNLETKEEGGRLGGKLVYKKIMSDRGDLWIFQSDGFDLKLRENS